MQTKMEKYEVDLKKKLMQDDLADASRDALEEAAYQRAQDREEAKRFQQQQEACVHRVRVSVRVRVTNSSRKRACIGLG
jgi:hypothetical protein